MFSCIRAWFSTIYTNSSEPKTNLVETNLATFLASSKYRQLQQEYPDISFTEPVAKDQLVENEQYLMVCQIHCWDDITHHDHDCRLDYDIDRVIFKGLKKDLYEFVYDTDKMKVNTTFYIYRYIIDGENASDFFYRINDFYFIKPTKI